MIQDISPYRLDNAYRETAPALDDCVFSFRGDEVLLWEGEDGGKDWCGRDAVAPIYSHCPAAVLFVEEGCTGFPGKGLCHWQDRAFVHSYPGCGGHDDLYAPSYHPHLKIMRKGALRGRNTSPVKQKRPDRMMKRQPHT